MKPEQYWIARGRDVIGTDVLREGAGARQAETYQAIARWIVEHKIDAVLDVGCNVAALYTFLSMEGYEAGYFGLDTNPYALRAAYVYADVDYGDLRCLEYGEQDWQCVVVKDVLEHLENYEPLAEAFRVAREYVIVATYLPWTDQPQHIEQHADGYYTNRYCLGDVEAFAQRHGFAFEIGSLVSETNGTPNQITVWRRA